MLVEAVAYALNRAQLFLN